MATDPKKALVEGKRRALTIHDGARLTPTLVAVLSALSDEAHAVAEAGREPREVPAHAYARAVPVLVARSDGLAVYVNRDGRVL